MIEVTVNWGLVAQAGKAFENYVYQMGLLMLVGAVLSGVTWVAMDAVERFKARRAVRS